MKPFFFLLCIVAALAVENTTDGYYVYGIPRNDECPHSSGGMATGWVSREMKIENLFAVVPDWTVDAIEFTFSWNRFYFLTYLAGSPWEDKSHRPPGYFYAQNVINGFNYQNFYGEYNPGAPDNDTKCTATVYCRIAISALKDFGFTIHHYAEYTEVNGSLYAEGFYPAPIDELTGQFNHKWDIVLPVRLQIKNTYQLNITSEVQNITSWGAQNATIALVLYEERDDLPFVHLSFVTMVNAPYELAMLDWEDTLGWQNSGFRRSDCIMLPSGSCMQQWDTDLYLSDPMTGPCVFSGIYKIKATVGCRWNTAAGNWVWPDSCYNSSLVENRVNHVDFAMASQDFCSYTRSFDAGAGLFLSMKPYLATTCGASCAPTYPQQDKFVADNHVTFEVSVTPLSPNYTIATFPFKIDGFTITEAKFGLDTNQKDVWTGFITVWGASLGFHFGTTDPSSVKHWSVLLDHTVLTELVTSKVPYTYFASVKADVQYSLKSNSNVKLMTSLTVAASDLRATTFFYGSSPAAAVAASPAPALSPAGIIGVCVGGAVAVVLAVVVVSVVCNRRRKQDKFEVEVDTMEK